MTSGADLNRAYMQRIADAFKQVDWPIAPYLQLGGFLSPLAAAIENPPTQDAKLAIIRERLASAYTGDYLAIMYLERYSKILHVREFARQIDESIRTYFCGYTFNAVTGLLPVIEGIIRKIATSQGRDVGPGTKGLNVELQAIVERELQSAYCYGERLVMLEAFRDFVRDRLLENTKRFVGLNEFNRHGILHGLFDDFGRAINFLRLITLLDLLCFCIGMTEGGRCLLQKIHLNRPPWRHCTVICICFTAAGKFNDRHQSEVARNCYCAVIADRPITSFKGLKEGRGKPPSICPTTNLSDTLT